MNLYCKTCNHQISTVDLQPASAKLVRAKANDQEQLIEEGLFIEADEIDILFGVHIDILVNRKSVDLRSHKDASKLAGCCGPGELGVLNYVCAQCSAGIGLIIEDCWLPHFVGIALEKTSYEPLS